jgi:serine/threonine-protein kinase
MDAERWQRVGAWFDEALACDADARAQVVAAAHAEEPALGALLQALLEAHARTGGLATGAALDVALGPGRRPDDTPALAEGARVGPYEVLGELGRGGMGAVYLARRADGGFDQRVAIKVLKRGMDSDEIVRRFTMERQILAGLAHPHIARLHDGGSLPDGRPYFVMEHVDGQPLPQHAAERRLGLEARLRLFLAVCSAVQFAHRNLVVHRDLKPANVLVNRDGQPKLLDFGIAKLLGTANEGPSTSLDARPMTPQYASPEQLAGGPITTATDVYALGLLLYELLTGRNPQAEGRPAGALPRASAFLGTPPPGLPAEAGRLAGALRGDLEAILTKALEPEPARRYDSVAALADDLERHLSHRPVTARHPTWSYRAQRFVRRHKLASAAALALAFAIATMAWQAYAVAQARDRAEAQQRRSQALATFLIDVFKVSDPDRSRGEKVTVRELLDAGATRLSAGTTAPRPWFGATTPDLQADPATRADLLHAIGEVYGNLGLPQQAQSTLRQALGLRERLTGHAAELDTARTLIQLGHVARYGADYARSAQYYERALTLRLGRLGAQAPEVAESRNALGLLYRVQNQRPAARREFDAAIAIWRASGPRHRLDLAETLANLAALLLEDEQLAAARPVLEEALQIDQELLADGDPRRLRDLAALAVLLFKLGDYAGAETRFQQLVDGRRRLLGDRHPDLAVALNNLSSAQYALGRRAQAEAAAREAIAIHRGQYPGPHPRVASELVNLASIVAEAARPAEAERLYREALAIYAALPAPGDALAEADALEGLALVCRDRQDLAAAEQHAQRALGLRRRLLGSSHPSVATTLALLGALAQRAQRPSIGETYYREALQLQQRTLTPTAPELAATRVGLGSLLLQAGRPSEALALLEQGLSAQQAGAAPDSLRVARTESTLGACQLALGNVRASRALLQSSLAVLRAQLGAEHPDTRLTATRLASAEAAQRP